MSNRRVKSMAVDDDDEMYDDGYDDDYDEDESHEIADEDKEQLRMGTSKVHQALGPNHPATNAEIEEALWHYYYDVGKSVTYLKNKHKPATQTPKKQPPNGTKSKQRLSFFLAHPWTGSISTNEAVQVSSDGVQDISGTRNFSKSISMEGFFGDCPWGQVPHHRQALIVEIRQKRRGGLLGGASKDGKTSKLAALAARRRQQNSTKSSESTDAASESSDYAESLRKLRISQADPMARRATRSTETEQSSSEDQAKKPHAMDVDAETAPPEESPTEPAQDLRAQPSAFANILTRSAAVGTPSPFSLLDAGKFSNPFDFAEPSPDDIVNKAQTSKGPPATSTSKTKQKESAAPTPPDLSSGVAKVSIQEKVRSKNFNVLAEYKKVKRKNAANFVVIGHVDAGKSTLMGRLLFDLKAVDQRTMDKYKKEAERIGKGSFAFAWVLDQGSEERARGVTIDIATNKFETDKTSFTILDAPGHRDFVPNMIAGASQADFAVLVIDSSPGNFESGLKGQTREHALLVRSIGVQRIIVAVNKMDVAGWSKERFDEIQVQMVAFLASAGFQKKNVSFVPCSGLEGANILTRVDEERASWYTGPTLVEELDESEPTTHAMDKPLRLTISDVFRGGVVNPLSISGRIEAGNLQVGDSFLVMPACETGQVKAVEVGDEDQDWAVAGMNVILHLTGIDQAHIKTGDVICGTTSPIQNVAEFQAKVLAFDHLTPMRVDVHRGRMHVPGRIFQLVATLDKSTGAVLKKKPRLVKPGSWVKVVVRLDQAVPLQPPARIIFRSSGETVAAGIMES